MKSHFLKVVACVMLTGVCKFAHAQTEASKPARATNQAPAANGWQNKRANDVVARISADVQLTDEQKTQLLASVKEAVATYAAAVKTAKETAESSLATTNSDLITDIVNRMRVILTPEQFTIVMRKENNAK